jgi:hypothetical protein
MTDLYILVYPERKKLKVGISQKAEERVAQLTYTWGMPCYESSYVLTGLTDSRARKLESHLHLLLDDHHSPYDDGDGRTEFFDIDALPLIIEGVEFYCRNVSSIPELKKGLSEPKDRGSGSAIQKRRKPKTDRRKKIAHLRRVSASRITLVQEFHRLARILNILKVRNSSIQYEITKIAASSIMIRILDCNAALYQYVRNRNYFELDAADAYYSENSLSRYHLTVNCKLSRNQRGLTVKLQIPRTDDYMVLNLWADIIEVADQMPSRSLAAQGNPNFDRAFQ